jgi:hypothetical protein
VGGRAWPPNVDSAVVGERRARDGVAVYSGWEGLLGRKRWIRQGTRTHAHEVIPQLLGLQVSIPHVDQEAQEARILDLHGTRGERDYVRDCMGTA